MSHQFVEGFFSNNEPAWHGLGKVLPAGVWPGKEEAMKLAGHDWKVVSHPVFARVGGVEVELRDKQALFTDKGTPLAVVNDTYGIIQNDIPYNLVEAVAKEGIKWHCGITLQNGRCVVVGYLPEAWTVPGDNSPTFPFLTALWAHDGTTALKLIRTAIRVVCANTKAMAESEAGKTGLEITVRHTRNWEDYIEKARVTLAQVRKNFDEYKELASELARMSVTQAQVDEFLRAFLPMPDLSQTQYSERVKYNVETARQRTQAILAGENTAPAHRQTAYGLWQAGLEYLQHTRKTRASHSKFNRSILREETVAENLHKLVISVAK